METQNTTLKKFSFESFQGGMRRNVDPTQLDDNEYPLLINGRTRHGAIIPIKKPRQLTGLPTGNYQGCYGAENLLLTFIEGKAYMQDLSATNPRFFKIASLQLDRDVETIFAELIPESFFNFNRTADGTDITAATITEETTTISQASVVVQDGLNTPWIIEPGYAARRLQRFSEWSLTGKREYVPIGRNMLYHDGKLYIISADRKSIYHSVTGRPIDFVIAVDDNGNKLSALPDSQEEAYRLAHKVSYFPITAISPLNVTVNHPDFGSPIMVNTTGGSYKMIPVFTTQLYGEPTFKNNDLFPTGALNQFSIALANGNIQFIDEVGLREFNAVEQVMVVSKDTALSGPIFQLFTDVKQTITCCTFFDNYTLFSVETIYGPGVIVYDNLLKRFSAIDMFDGVGKIKQFCQTTVDGIRRLFFITTDNKMYEYYGSSDTALCRFYTKECTMDDEEFNHQLARLKLDIHDIEKGGSISATSFSDRLREQTLTQAVDASMVVQSNPQSIPFGDGTKDTTTPVTFAPQNTKLATKIGYFLEFDFQGDLHGIQIMTKPVFTKVGLKQQAKFYKR